MKYNVLVLILTALLATTLACSYAKTSCKAIHVADNVCHVLVLEDGTTVQLSREDLEAVGRVAIDRADAGADR